MGRLALWGSLGRLWGGGIDTALYPAYHAVLGGVGLLLEKGGYERRLGQTYAAKLATAGTNQTGRIGDQVLELSQWDGGEGHLRHDTSTPDRYRNGSGIDPFTEEGAVGLGPHMSAIAGVTSLALNELTCMIPYQGYLMLGFSNGKVYSLTGSTVTLAYDTTKAGGIRSFMILEGNLYVGTGSDGIVYRQYGSTLTANWAANFTVGPTTAGGTATVTGVYAMSMHCQEGVLAGFYTANQTATKPVRSYAMIGNEPNTGGTTLPANAFLAFDSNVSVLIQYQGKLVAVSYDSTDKHWHLYEGDASTTIGWELKSRQEGGYINVAAVLDDDLYLGDAVQGRIWKWNGSDLTLAHQLGSDLSPYTAEIKGMVAWRGGLWVSILDTDGTCALLRFDGRDSWSRPVTGLSGTTPGALCVYNDQLYYATNSTGAARLYKTNGTFTSAGSVESALINADLTGTGKLWTGIKINHTALVSGQSVQVQYKTEDTGSWTSLGTSSTVGATSAEFDFPSAVTAEQIAFKILLAGAAGSSTPLKVFALVGRYMPAPGAQSEWTLRVQLYGNDGRKMPLLDGSTSPLTGEEIAAAVWGLVEAVVPVNFVDTDRQEYTVQIVEWSHADAGMHLGTSGDGWEFDGSLTLREV
jgi:hypothetical protein